MRTDKRADPPQRRFNTPIGPWVRGPQGAEPLVLLLLLLLSLLLLLFRGGNADEDARLCKMKTIRTAKKTFDEICVNYIIKYTHVFENFVNQTWKPFENCGAHL